MTGSRLAALIAPLMATILLAVPGSPGPSSAVVAAVTAGLALAAAACVAARVVAVPARVVARDASWPGHPARREGGDLPRQQHPDAAGRARPRAPGRF